MRKANRGLLIRNVSEAVQIRGNFYGYSGADELFHCKTIELPWRDNLQGVSCVPAETYQIVLEHSSKFKTELFELKGVKGRSECKFHWGNYYYLLEGCILVGKEFADINHDGYNDVTDTRNTVNRMKEVFAKNWFLTIVNAY